jgi:broad specificity phosphatase PhoE
LVILEKETLTANRLFVVRHGETWANARGINAGPLDYSLTKRGKTQVEFLAKALSKIKISAIYCSPIFRTVETARILDRPHKLGVQTHEGLVEVRLKSKFLGKKGGQRILTKPEDYDETYGELQKRIVRTISEIKNQTSGNVIVVSHGDPIAALLQYVVERKIGKKRYYVIHPDPGSVSVIEFKDKPELILFNYHLKQF